MTNLFLARYNAMLAAVASFAAADPFVPSVNMSRIERSIMGKTRSISRKWHDRSCYEPHQGTRECYRRIRQGKAEVWGSNQNPKGLPWPG